MQLYIEPMSAHRLYTLVDLGVICFSADAAIDAKYFPDIFHAAVAFDPHNLTDAQGILVYTTNEAALEFRYIHVCENSRHQGIAKALICNVVLDPRNICVPTVTATAGTIEGNKLNSYIEELPGKLHRICGTSFCVRTTPYPWI